MTYNFLGVHPRGLNPLGRQFDAKTASYWFRDFVSSFPYQVFLDPNRSQRKLRKMFAKQRKALPNQTLHTNWNSYWKRTYGR